MPSMLQTVEALIAIRDALDEQCCYQIGGRFHFRLNAVWTVALSADSAGRFRIEACYCGRPLATMWALAGDLDRIADLALAARSEVLALSAV